MRKLFGTLLVAFILLAPSFYVESKEFEYTPLEPSFFRVTEGTAVNASTFFGVLYKTALWAAVVLAVLMIVIAGVEYTAGGISESAKSDARHRIENALVGLFLALFAYLFLQTLNPQLVGTTLEVPQSSGIAGGSSSGSGGGGTSSGPAGPAAVANEQEKKGYYFIKKNNTMWDLGGPYTSLTDCNNAQLVGAANNTNCSLEDNGMRWLNTTIYDRLRGSSEPGSPVGVNRADYPCLYSEASRKIIKTECTTVAKLPEKSIMRLRYLSQAVGGGVIVTGGTEPYGHRTHGYGNNNVDIRETPELKTYLEGRLGKSFTGCRESVTLTGAVSGTYYWEPVGCANSTGNHWHVTFN